MSIRLLLLALFFSSCFLSVKKTPIERPEIDRSYYVNSIEALEAAIQDQPDYTPFIILQLNYYEQIGWPAEAEQAINRAEKYLASDPDFFARKISFYRSNQRFQELIKALERYPVEGELPLSLQMDYTLALISINDTLQSKYMLNRLEAKNDSTLINFILYGYRLLSDTSSMLALFERNASVFDEDELSDLIIPIYLERKQYSRVIEIGSNLFSTNKNPKHIRNLAVGYIGMDSLSRAEQMLVMDTTLEGQMLLAETMLKQNKYTSSIRILNSIIKRDSASILPLRRLAEVENDRGYYLEAIAAYEKLLEIDSTDEDAKRQINQINKNIAYLRLQKQRNQIQPILGLDSLKKEIN